MVTEPASPAILLRRARTEAQLSQRQLARLAGTAQSVVARIEGGVTDPSWMTLQRLLAAAGFELRADLVVTPAVDSQMFDDVERILRLSPEDRLLEVANVSRFLAAARRV